MGLYVGFGIVPAVLSYFCKVYNTIFKFGMALVSFTATATAGSIPAIGWLGATD